MCFHWDAITSTVPSEFRDGAAYVGGLLGLRLVFALGCKNQSSLRMKILNGRELND
jgi:hypothetical protein